MNVKTLSNSPIKCHRKMNIHVCDVSRPTIGDNFLCYFTFHINYDDSINIRSIRETSGNEFNKLITQEILLDGRPRTMPQRRLLWPKLQAAKLWFEGQMVEGKCIPLKSTLSYINISQTERLGCGDYREINRDNPGQISNSSYRRQIPMNSNDIHKTALTSTFGMSKCLVKTFVFGNPLENRNLKINDFKCQFN